MTRTRDFAEGLAQEEDAIDAKIWPGTGRRSAPFLTLKDLGSISQASPTYFHEAGKLGSVAWISRCISA
eukprot:4646064-Lingulodinium_polyedra.AAC.1